MNPEEDVRVEKSPRRTPRSKTTSKLKQSISESKMLQLLDLALDPSSNQTDDGAESELLCDSTMVSLASEWTPEHQACDRRGVLNTIRSIHRTKQPPKGE
ncbi:hypothetical protein SDRG_06020 [Saprolegnia diclina VS20]|uniref:Uncharacterized protein n=1 Tax=Saprolegnia diclina (strain VS20) TaxID=1156394 RepID=T0QRL3_SAPDV|nr:hypothetical protein SDRG_06020 [Saprolegnia diclina VS20]EQC36575.1 hypothetical protein SDRG_06020 [Saprolegnia diclina VS20]|eukprot:XP_008609996.1 hypothetical protein SDRG_06020 [Saprolegnia diclina VS20]